MNNRFSLLLVSVILCLTLALPAAWASVCNELDGEINAQNKRFSVVNTGLERDSFSDIGCAISYRDNLCAHELADFDVKAQVHDFRTGEATRMSTAYFVLGSNMKYKGFDIVAFKTRECAEAFASEHGARVLDFGQLTREPLSPVN